MDKHATKYVSSSNRLLLTFIVVLYAIPLVLFVEDILGAGRYYYYFIEVGVAIGFAVIADWVYISIQNNKTHSSALENKSITVFNKDAHRFCFIIIIAVWPLRLPLYFIDHPEWNKITSVDVGLFTAFIILITLDRLYKNNYMYLYTALLTTSLSIYYVALVSESINADNIIHVLSNLFLIIISIPIILLLYKIPIKVIKKHNKAINHDAL